MLYLFFFKQKTAYEMRISDWSSDVCSSDLPPCHRTDSKESPKCHGSGVRPSSNHPSGGVTGGESAMLFLSAAFFSSGAPLDRLGAHTGTEIFMAAFARIRLVMLSGVACSILAAFGADGFASPRDGWIVIPASTPTPAPTPTPTPTPPPT